MKFKLFTLATMLAMTFVQFNISNAQSTIFSEDFENGMPVDFTIIDNDMGVVDPGLSGLFTDGWIVNADEGDFSAGSTSWNTPIVQADDWMITSAITIGSGAILSWSAQAQDPSFPDGYEVRIGSSPTIASMLSNPPLFSIGSENTVYTQRTIDLEAAGYSNQTIYLAWRNNSIDQFILYVDDITVEKTTECSLDLTIIDPGTLQSSESLPCLDKSAIYNESIAFKAFDMITIGGNIVTMNWFRIDSIKGLPQGIGWVTSETDNTFVNSENGCINFFGTAAPSVLNGQYELEVFVCTDIGFQICDLPLSTFGWKMFLRVADPGNDFQCQPVDTNLMGFSPYSQSCSVNAPTMLGTTGTGIESSILFWNMVPNASGYEIRGGLLGSGNYAYLINGPNSLSVAGLKAGTEYEWQVRAFCNFLGTTMYSPWSAMDTFRTNSCNVPVPILNNSNNNCNSALIEWFDGFSSDAVKIRGRKVGVANWSTFSFAPAQSQFYVSGLTPGATYEWQIASICYGASGTVYTSSWSAINSFTLPGCSSKSLVDEDNYLSELENSLILFPNPSDGEFSVRFNTKHQLDVEIKVVNFLGQSVYRSELSEFSGSYNEQINSSEWSAGIYMVTLQLAERTITKKILIH